MNFLIGSNLTLNRACEVAFPETGSCIPSLLLLLTALNEITSPLWALPFEALLAGAMPQSLSTPFFVTPGKNELSLSPLPRGSVSSVRRSDLFCSIVSVPTLSLGHGFGMIPAPGSFASSAFPVPPKKSSETTPKILVSLPKSSRSLWEQYPLASGCPNFKGRNGEKVMYINVVHLIGYLGKNPEHKSVRATDRKYAVLSLATQRS